MSMLCIKCGQGIFDILFSMAALIAYSAVLDTKKDDQNDLLANFDPKVVH
jgi:hypothetical protein